MHRGFQESWHAQVTTYLPYLCAICTPLGVQCDLATCQPGTRKLGSGGPTGGAPGNSTNAQAAQNGIHMTSDGSWWPPLVRLAGRDSWEL